jgi:hypothetical protein
MPLASLSTTQVSRKAWGSRGHAPSLTTASCLAFGRRGRRIDGLNVVRAFGGLAGTGHVNHRALERHRHLPSDFRCTPFGFGNVPLVVLVRSPSQREKVAPRLVLRCYGAGTGLRRTRVSRCEIWSQSPIIEAADVCDRSPRIIAERYS